MESATYPTDCENAGSKILICVNGEMENNFDAILSNEGRIIFEYVNYVIICGIVVLFGMTSNIINIIIFYKQGFVNNTANIAFFSLAISDFCCLMSLGWASISMNPLLPVNDVTWASVEVMYLSAGWPHVCFCRITSYITVYITAERFISIALPLKVKQIVTTKRTTLVISLIYIVNIVTLIPEYVTSYLDWRYIQAKNKTLIGIVFRTSRGSVEGLCHAVHSLLSATSFFGVIFFTFALVSKLRESSKWRIEANLGHSQAQSTSTKEMKTVKMVVLIASVLIICYIPGATIAMTTFIVGEEFNVKGKYLNICEAAWSTALSFQSMNSSVNIFLYYKMSSKYRQIFIHICKKLLRCNNNSVGVNNAT